MLLMCRCLYSLFTQNKILQGYSLRHIHGSVQLHISRDSTVTLVVDLHSTLIDGSIDYSEPFSQTVALHNNAIGKGNCCGWRVSLQTLSLKCSFLLPSFYLEEMKHIWAKLICVKERVKVKYVNRVVLKFSWP